MLKLIKMTETYKQKLGEMIDERKADRKVKTVAIVSLSSGMLGEDFVSHELEIGRKRLESYGIAVRFMPHALRGIEYLKNHPEKRAQDLLLAFRDPDIDMILCAIGGDDTYRLLPHLFADRELERAASQKIFLGFSDTTMNHLMLHKVGVRTFYGQAFIPDVCELADEMLPYTRRFFEELIRTGRIEEIRPSEIRYEEREDFSEAAVGVPAKQHPNRGFELLCGAPVFEGRILGGCLESLYDIFDATRHEDSPSLCRAYELFPSLEDWRGRILLLETSEEKPSPDLFRKMIRRLKGLGLFDVLSGLLVGQPQDEAYHGEYKAILREEFEGSALPIVCNINVGHSKPRCIVPFGVPARVDATAQRITFDWGSGGAK